MDQRHSVDIWTALLAFTKCRIKSSEKRLYPSTIARPCMSATRNADIVNTSRVLGKCRQMLAQLGAVSPSDPQSWPSRHTEEFA